MNELMNGVEILSSLEVVIETAFSTFGFMIAFFGCLTFSLVSGFFTGRSINAVRFGLWIGLIVGVIFGLFFGFVTGSIFSEPVAYETHYKVTIDDSVSINEFLDSYEIVDIEDKIYTVRAKTDSALAS